MNELEFEGLDITAPSLSSPPETLVNDDTEEGANVGVSLRKVEDLDAKQRESSDVKNPSALLCIIGHTFEQVCEEAQPW